MNPAESSPQPGAGGLRRSLPLVQTNSGAYLRPERRFLRFAGYSAEIASISTRSTSLKAEMFCKSAGYSGVDFSCVLADYLYVGRRYAHLMKHH
jgi:hypothetical protein